MKLRNYKRDKDGKFSSSGSSVDKKKKGKKKSGLRQKLASALAIAIGVGAAHYVGSAMDKRAHDKRMKDFHDSIMKDYKNRSLSVIELRTYARDSNGKFASTGSSGRSKGRGKKGILSGRGKFAAAITAAAGIAIIAGKSNPKTGTHVHSGPIPSGAKWAGTNAKWSQPGALKNAAPKLHDAMKKPAVMAALKDVGQTPLNKAQKIKTPPKPKPKKAPGRGTKQRKSKAASIRADRSAGNPDNIQPELFESLKPSTKTKLKAAAVLAKQGATYGERKAARAAIRRIRKNNS